jgi:hypothetical protein
MTVTGCVAPSARNSTACRTAFRRSGRIAAWMTAANALDLQVISAIRRNTARDSAERKP